MLLGGITVGVFILYAAFITYFTLGLKRLRNKPKSISTKEPLVTVVVAARNEEENICNLLEDLSHQTYPNDKLQVIISNDRSTDGTWSIIKEFSNKYDNIHGIQISELSDEMTPKKNALTKAIESSEGEIIISTDADCRVSATWVKSIVESFDVEVGVVVGYSKVDTNPNKFFYQYQAIDFLALMTANAGPFGWNQSWAGSGQNIAYRREAFNDIDGFNPVAHQTSGDDFYLVQAISRISEAKYNINSMGFVKTRPMETVQNFISQRTRWASNSKKLFNTNLLFLLFLFVNLFVNIIILSSILYRPFWQFLPFIFGFKFLFDTILLFYGSDLFETKIKFFPYLIWLLLQPIYTILLAILSLAGKYQWKQ